MPICGCFGVFLLLGKETETCNNWLNGLDSQFISLIIITYLFNVWNNQKKFESFHQSWWDPMMIAKPRWPLITFYLNIWNCFWVASEHRIFPIIKFKNTFNWKLLCWAKITEYSENVKSYRILGFDTIERLPIDKLYEMFVFSNFTRYSIWNSMNQSLAQRTHMKYEDFNIVSVIEWIGLGPISQRKSVMKIQFVSEWEMRHWLSTTSSCTKYFAFDSKCLYFIVIHLVW